LTLGFGFGLSFLALGDEPGSKLVFPAAVSVAIGGTNSLESSYSGRVVLVEKGNGSEGGSGEEA
jgi:hypothetical protein